MKIHDIGRYNEAREKIKELEPLLNALDNVCDILYNNLGNNKILYLIEKVEDVRIEYYIKHYEYMQTVNNKGKVNYE